MAALVTERLNHICESPVITHLYDVYREKDYFFKWYLVHFSCPYYFGWVRVWYFKKLHAEVFIGVLRLFFSKLLILYTPLRRWTLCLSSNSSMLMSCLDYFGVSHILIPGMLTNHLLSFLSCYGDEFFRNVIIQVFFLVVLISSTDENHMHCTEEAQQAETCL